MGLDPTNLPPHFTRRIAVTPKKKDVQNPIQLHPAVVQEQQNHDKRKKRRASKNHDQSRVSAHNEAYGVGYALHIKLGFGNDRVKDPDGVLSTLCDCMKNAGWIHDDNWHYLREIHIYADPALEDFCEVELIPRKSLTP